MSEQKIDINELKQVFGDTIPMDVVMLLFGPGHEDRTVEEIRKEIIAIARTRKHMEHRSDSSYLQNVAELILSKRTDCLVEYDIQRLREIAQRIYENETMLGDRLYLSS